MGRNRFLLFSASVVLILGALILYQRYNAVQSETVSVYEALETRQQTLTKTLALIAEKPVYESELARLKEVRKAEGLKLLEGQTASIAAATLQDTIKNIVTSRGGTISSERAGKVETVNRFQQINITVDTVIPDIKALGDILYAIETRTPQIIIRELDIRIRNIKNPKELIVKLDAAALSNSK